MSWLPSDMLPTNATRLNDFRDGLNVRVYNESQAMDGLNLFSLTISPNYTGRDQEGYVLVTDMQGNIRNGFYIPGQSLAPRLVNSTTAVYADRSTKLISFWNFVTNKTEDTLAPAGHHEFDYNPLTDTFMSFSGWREEYFDVSRNDTYDVTYDDLAEYDRDGNELWHWSANSTFPFNYTEFSLRNEIKRSTFDWMHSNSIFWDVEEGAVYVSVRHLDCVVKVDYATGETDWVVGRYTGTADPFTLYNVYGEETDALFYHTHSCEVIGPNRFIIYDNDLWNLTRPNPEIGLTRYVEFEVDEDAQTASEVWVWTSPQNYYQHSQGNADRLPNGNTVGLFNDPPEPWYTEVNQEGEIVWEWTFNITDNDAGFKTPANAFQRFFEEPLVELINATDAVVEGLNATINLRLWDTFSRRYSSDGVVRVLEGTEEIYEAEFEFLPHWQENQLSVDIAGLAVGSHNLGIEIENSDGVIASVSITVDVQLNLILYGAIASGAIAIVVVTVIVLKKRKGT